MASFLSRVALAFVVMVAATAAVQRLSAAQAPQRPNSLQSLVNDVAAQFQLAYRHDPAEFNRRHQELAAVVAAWRTEERNAANNRLLVDWLRAAMRNSMPGSSEPLPPMPEFGLLATGASSTASMIDGTTPTPIGDKSAGNPFGDDPLPARE